MLSKRPVMKMKMPRISRFVLAAALLLSTSAAYAEEFKLGFVDMQRALNETEDGRKAKAALKKVFDQKQKELDEQQAVLKKDIEDLDKKRTLLPADQVREKEAELQQRMQKVQQTYLRHQQDLSGKEQEATAKIYERMNKIIQKIATTENFSMIVDKSALVFAKPHLDLTNDVIRRYNSGEGGGCSGEAGGVGEEVAVLDIRDIERILPHRYPFLLVDRVDELGPERIVARKLVSRNEPHFNGHFPGHPVMPGVLIIEALAQAGALLAASVVSFDPAKQVIYFMAIDKAQLPQAGRAGRRAVAGGDAAAQGRRHLEAAGRGQGRRDAGGRGRVAGVDPAPRGRRRDGSLNRGRCARRQALTLAATMALAGCHRAGLPPRPDGAAVVVTAEQTDDGMPTLGEVEPNDTLAAAQKLALTETTGTAVGGDLRPRGAKRDADVYLVQTPARDAGAADQRGADAGPLPPRLVLRVDLRPGAGLAVALDALDDAGHVLVTAAGGAGEPIAIPNLAVVGGAVALRVRAVGPEGATPTYRLAARLGAFDAGAEIEPNGDAAHATDLSLGGEAVGYLGWHRDQDWYRAGDGRRRGRQRVVGGSGSGRGGRGDAAALRRRRPQAQRGARPQGGARRAAERAHSRRRADGVRGGADGRRLERVGALQPAPARRAAAPRLRGRAERRHRARAARRGRHRARVPGARRRGCVPLHDGGDRAAGRRGRAAREGERAGRVAARGRNAAGARRERSPRPGAHQRRVDPGRPDLRPRLAAAAER